MLTAALLVALASLVGDDPPQAVAITADGRCVVTLSSDGTLRTLSAADGREVSRVAPSESGLPGVPFLTADGTLAALLPARSSSIDICRVAADAPPTTIGERRSTAEAVGLSGDGQAVAVAFHLDAGVTRLRVVKGAGAIPRPVARVGGHVHGLALSHNGDWLISLAHEERGGKDVLTARPCELFDVGTGLSLWSRPESFRHAVISADDRYAVLTGGSVAVPNRVVDLADGEPARDRTPPKFAIIGPPVVSADGGVLFAMTADALMAWDLVAGREKFRLPMTASDTPARRAALSPDGRLLVTTFDGLRSWDAVDGKPLWGPMTRTMK